jgi:RNA polymerase sigma-70 factor (ECF subfamily)
MALVWNTSFRRGETPCSGSVKIVIMTRDRSMKTSFQDLALPQLAPLYNHARWLVQDSVEAEDLVQETIAKAWIFRILRNTFLTSRTAIAHARTVFIEDQPGTFDAPDSTPSPEAELIRLDNQALVRDALEQLAPHLREVILLCDLEELKYREIAVILDVPIGTVMSRLARARQTMRELVAKEAGEKP